MRLSLHGITVEHEPSKALTGLFVQSLSVYLKSSLRLTRKKKRVRVNEASSSHHKRTQPATVCVSGLVTA